MPGMSGRDLLPVVKTRQPDLPVFMISSHGNTGTVDMAQLRGARKVLTKPVNFVQLEPDVIAVIADVGGVREAERTAGFRPHTLRTCHSAFGH